MQGFQQPNRVMEERFVFMLPNQPLIQVLCLPFVDSPSGHKCTLEAEIL